MAIVSLLRLPLTVRERWAFVFEHDQAHRKWVRELQKQKKPKRPHQTHLLDPMQRENWPASKWHFDHQLSHNTIAAGVPPTVGPPPTPGSPPQTVQILADSDLFRLRQKKWWEFANHLEHYWNQSIPPRKSV